MLAPEAWRRLVLVQVVPARQVVARRVRPSGDAVFGQGLVVNDQDQLVAGKMGAVTVDHLGRICLADVQRSAGLDERPKTIVVEGSMVIAGPVGPDWCIRASGDVEVRGFVNEATIVAGGSVLVRGDVIGSGSGSGSMIVAGWDVMLNQATDTEILAGHHVAVAEQLRNCTVTAGGRILVGSPPMESGVIGGGGVLHAGREVAVFRAGSTAGFPPELIIGPMPSVAGIDAGGDPAAQKQQLAGVLAEVTDRLPRLEGPRDSDDITELRQTYRSLWRLWIRERELLQLSDGEACPERVAVYGMLALGSQITIGAKRITVGHEMTGEPVQFVAQSDRIVMQRAEPLQRPANAQPLRPAADPGQTQQAKRLAVKLPSSMVHELDLVNMIDAEGVEDTWAVLSRLESELRLAEGRRSIRRLLVKDPDTGTVQGHCYRREDVARIATSIGIRVVQDPNAGR